MTQYAKNTPKPFLITTGDPLGIGMDIVLDVFLNARLHACFDNVHGNNTSDTKSKTDVKNNGVNTRADTKNHPCFIITACINNLKTRYEVLAKKGMFRHVPNFIQVDFDDVVNGFINNHTTNMQLIQHRNDTSYTNDSHAHYTKPVDIFVINTPAIDSDLDNNTPNKACAPSILAQLYIAHTLALQKTVQAIITAPLAKSFIIEYLQQTPKQAQYDDINQILSHFGQNFVQKYPFFGQGLQQGFIGHTEFFMHACSMQKVVMMLANKTMRVALVTTHIALKDVAKSITHENVTQTIRIVHSALIHQFGINKPNIVVCGLNPHAGENGQMGDEEASIINPALATLRQQGVLIKDALPADTAFTPHVLQHADAIVAMYHDQGLAPLKSHGFGNSVNITLGLPYIRTSVDHGTAFDLSGTGRASPDSLLCAITYAYQMAGVQ